MKHVKEIFDEVLNLSNNKYVCEDCGRPQSHTDVYCKSCGKKYIILPNTYGELLRICFNRNNISKPTLITPRYIAGLNSRFISRESGVDRDVVEKILENI